MGYPSYLVHYNKNHDKLGRFTIGDGDGDGTRDDHHNQDKETAGQKIKRAVDTYDSVRADIRNRSLKDAEYKVKKGNLDLKQDEIANARNQEQSSVKSRKMDLSIQRQQARLEKEQMRNALREERARAYIERYRMKKEMKAEKAEDRAAKNYERNMKRAERNAARERRQQQRDYERSIRKQQQAIERYNNAASRQRTKAFISLATGNLIGAGIHAYNASKYSNRANSYQ